MRAAAAEALGARAALSEEAVAESARARSRWYCKSNFTILAVRCWPYRIALGLFSCSPDPLPPLEPLPQVQALATHTQARTAPPELAPLVRAAACAALGCVDLLASSLDPGPGGMAQVLELLLVEVSISDSVPIFVSCE